MSIARMAAALNLPLLYVSRHDRYHRELALLKSELEQARVRVAGAVVSGLPPGAAYARAAEETANALQAEGWRAAALLPADARLAEVSVGEVARELKAEVLFGRESVDRQARAPVLRAPCSV